MRRKVFLSFQVWPVQNDVAKSLETIKASTRMKPLYAPKIIYDILIAKIFKNPPDEEKKIGRLLTTLVLSCTSLFKSAFKIAIFLSVISQPIYTVRT